VLEDRQRRQIAAARRKALEELRRKQRAERQKFESELKKEREARERAEAALRKFRAEQRKREIAERTERARARRLQQVTKVRTPPGSSKLGEKRRTQISTGNGDSVGKSGGNGQGREPSTRTPPRRYAEAGNPWRRNDGYPQVARAGVARLIGRWCGPRGAIRFTRSHMVARRYDNGEVGRYQLAGYHVGPRSIVVQYLMPDGMHRLAFGRFSLSGRRMIELAGKQPGDRWRRIGAPWHRC
jgi:hypothetical protein